MAEVLADLPVTKHPNLLVGYNKADDAGVFQLSEDLALVQTVDFFPPIVDDPYDFGQIAAANALSDIYAMGGRPLTALNIVGFPSDTMPPEILTEILRGGSNKVEEAGAVVVGGHSIKDKELKYGLAITGIVDPNKITTNGGARSGDSIYLTKPLGTGLITTGIKRKAVGDDLAALATKQMVQLNAAAAEIMVACGANAATDITGYGLLGHTHEMAMASNVTIRLSSRDLPLMPEAERLAAAGMIPGGANANRDFLKGRVRILSSVDSSLEYIVYDPQTSGGLLISIPRDKAQEFEQELKNKEVFAQKIGHVETQTEISVVLE